MAATAATSDSVTRRFAVAFGLHVRAAGVPPPQQQLTIFYGGRVVVLDGCPPEKAAELIRLAAAAVARDRLPALLDMPTARKASLRRFLSKRKARSSSASPAPYDAELGNGEPAAKRGRAVVDDAASWLALGPVNYSR